MSGYEYRGNKRPPAATYDNVVELAAASTPDPDEALLDMPDLYDHGHKSQRGGKCKRGCCWNPFDVCPFKRRCRCHPRIAKIDPPHLADIVPFPTFDMLDDQEGQAA